MTEFLDALEQRDPAVREQAMLAALPGAVAHAQMQTAAFAEIPAIAPASVSATANGSTVNTNCPSRSASISPGKNLFPTPTAAARRSRTASRSRPLGSSSGETSVSTTAASVS